MSRYTCNSNRHPYLHSLLPQLACNRGRSFRTSSLRRHFGVEGRSSRSGARLAHLPATGPSDPLGPRAVGTTEKKDKTLEARPRERHAITRAPAILQEDLRARGGPDDLPDEELPATGE